MALVYAAWNAYINMQTGHVRLLLCRPLDMQAHTDICVTTGTSLAQEQDILNSQGTKIMRACFSTPTLVSKLLSDLVQV